MPTLPPDLRLRRSPGRGRAVIATRAFSAGSTIGEFSDQGPSATPTVAVPDSHHISETCSHCLKVTASLLNSLSYSSTLNLDPNAGSSSITTSPSPSPSAPVVPRGAVASVRACTACRITYYCSTACQRASWDLVHGRGECKAYKRARIQAAKEGCPAVPPTPVRTLMQVLLRPEMLEAAYEMEGHEGQDRTAPGTSVLEMMLQVRAALDWLGRSTRDEENVAVGMDVTCKLQVNSFNRKDADFGQSGMYVNPALAMVNHSCIPNAYVSFTGRKAILHAYQDIKKGEEITISYTEHDCSRPQRQHHLKTHYYFDCECLRCKEDLDVYQVCQMYPNLELNSFSIMRDIDKLRNPPVKQFLNSSKALQRNIEEIYPICMAELQIPDATAMRKQLRQRWKLCAQLRNAGLYAIEPLNRVLRDAGLYFVIKGKFAHAFAIECFRALNSEPYIAPAPFFATRVQRMFMMTKILTSGPFSASTEGSSGELATKISRFSNKIDQPTMCQMLLLGVIYHCPAAKSDEWQLRYQALDMLDDLKSLAGRETENALVDTFTKNPNDPEQRRFFNTTVLEPIEEAAGFALEIINAEFGA
ncbi:uncharacterized protein F4807DRAFT_207617 [Annulohypoxylon truncatum]|uniref:uncharacterized protein n=1 Tax=Annulohypoxylon truncatum TaxID=327061 RepID=UPI002007D724|nr:uncharacterized protein F4807DRAFT_207617 [Annulohypoxylon truncatum]KAI1213976.1 hypothetical protein F4807DRAFT_207617 [Annulohypoxylon truncatum]